MVKSPNTLEISSAISNDLVGLFVIPFNNEIIRFFNDFFDISQNDQNTLTSQSGPNHTR